MGTGSHRPQWEAAKGRPDELAGIKHARALRSHTKLKFRDAPDRTVRKQITTGTDQHKHESNHKDGSNTGPAIDEKQKLQEKELNSDSPGSKNDEIDNRSGDSSDEDSEDSDSEELQRELERLTKRNALRAQKSKPKQPASRWRSEAVFSKKPKRDSEKRNDDFLDKFVR